MSNEQHGQQPVQAQTPQADARRDFVKKSALAAIGGIASGFARVATQTIIDAVSGDS
ncbi:twin-arginine translocation signal domain-containing protein [Streptomyces sp. NPDC000658]|uniref:twin-arginine translocation signal domain-containing protein n=1 Tax=Streptomyces sp. NPDC000658 TaxID=3154266 RepID=UPI00331A6527